jgi:TP901-1 family phage major tail protein
MAKFKGKDLLVQLRVSTGPDVFTTCAGMRSTGLTINAEAVDVTDKGDTPWRQLLDGCGINSMSLSLSGVFTDSSVLETMLQDCMTGTIKTFKLISGLGDVFVGTFKITSLERNGEYNGAEQYSMTLESAAAITYTPAP